MEREILQKYEADYSGLPFEDVLRFYRQRNIFKQLQSFEHRNVLEIGSGPQPIFKDFNDFERMMVVEPGESFYNIAREMAGRDPRITVINNFFEKVVDEIAPQTFDFIVIGGFLHEISNPEEVLLQVKKVCHPGTTIHTFVPNAHSFHRLMAAEMGMIKDVFQKSGHDELFNRVQVYNMDTFKKLFHNNRFSIISSGTYFLKPFTNAQMQDIVNKGIIDESVLEGLDRIIKHFPNHGSEMYVNAVAQF